MALLLRALLVLALALGGHQAHAGQACLVMPEEAGAFSEAAEAMGAELRSAGHRVQTFPGPLRAEDATTLNTCALIITLGARTAQGIAALAPRSLILHTLLPRSTYERLPLRPEDTRRVSAIFIDQPASRQIELLRIALPEWQRVALLVGPESLDMGQRLQLAARDRRLRPALAQISDESELYLTLQRTLGGEPGILLAIPDSTVYNNRTISNILLTAYHQRSPVVGFSPAYVKAGALLALYSTPAQVGQQAGEAGRLGLATGTLPPPAAPRHFRISTNPYVARSLGIQLEDPGTLRERLERSEAGQ